MKKKNKVTAAMLAFFTGFLGIQFLYLKKPGFFVLLLLLSIFTASILPAIIGFIHGFSLLNMSEHEFDRKYNRDFKPYHNDHIDRRREQQMKSYQEEYQRPQRAGGKPNLKPLSQEEAQVNILKKSGIKKYKSFDIDEAIEDFTQALRLAPKDAALHFNLACSYSLNENKELAYQHLSQSVAFGLKDVDKILQHDDLAFVRIQPEFDDFRKSGFIHNPIKQQNKAHKTTKSEDISYIEAPIQDALLAQINQLAELRKKGVLSEDEFLFERKKILRQ